MKYLILTLILILTVSCENAQDPQLIRVENYKVRELKLSNIQITADAVYYNPNPVGITVDSWDIDVSANGVDVGKVFLEIPTDIPAKGNFTIPIDINFPPKDVIKLDSGILIGVLTTFSNKEVELVCTGKVTMNVLGAKIDVPINETELIPLKKQ